MKTKKFLSVVLSAAMILGVAVPVAAEQSVEAEQQPSKSLRIALQVDIF